MDISLATQIVPEKRFEHSKDAQKADGVVSKKKDKEEKELKDACQGFEAIFLQSMMKSMRSTLPGDELFKGNNGMEIYTSMHDQYLTEKISKEGNASGIGEFLYRQLQDSL